MTIHKFVQKSRRKAGLTQKELATKLGCTSAQLISNIERGICSLPLEKAKTFCNITGASPKKLVSVLVFE